MGLPILLAVTVGLVWLLSLGVAQVRVVDGAREGARGLARGDPADVATARAAGVAGSGSEVSATYDEGRVTVTVARSVAGPGGLFDFLPAVRLDARAVAALESR